MCLINRVTNTLISIAMCLHSVTFSIIVFLVTVSFIVSGHSLSDYGTFVSDSQTPCPLAANNNTHLLLSLHLRCSGGGGRECALILLIVILHFVCACACECACACACACACVKVERVGERVVTLL